MNAKTYYPGQLRALTEEPLVCVVTPFFNSADYLEECIQSVLRQTYSNWEYILVDNCSTDGSGEIAERYASQDGRIRLIRETEFVGQVENYNRALKYISPESKYCKIVQADDWLFPECLVKMVQIGEEFPSVAVVGAYQLQDPDVLCHGLRYPSNFVPGWEIIRQYLIDGTYVFGTPTSVLFRSDVVRERRAFYDTKSTFEDSEICFELMRMHDFGFVHQVLTFSRTENNSITSSIREFNPYLLMSFIIFQKYGKACLSVEEYEACSKRIVKPYLRYLGKSVLVSRDQGFWHYHAEGLASIGFCLSKTKLLKFSASAVVGSIMDALKKLKKGSKFLFKSFPFSEK